MANDFYLEQLAPIVGATVTRLVTDQDDEFFALRLQLKDGTHRTLWLLSDDEGNAPGGFSLEQDDAPSAT